MPIISQQDILALICSFMKHFSKATGWFCGSLELGHMVSDLCTSSFTHALLNWYWEGSGYATARINSCSRRKLEQGSMSHPFPCPSPSVRVMRKCHSSLIKNFFAVAPAQKRCRQGINMWGRPCYSRQLSLGLLSKRTSLQLPIKNCLAIFKTQ